MARISSNVNGATHHIDTDPDCPLLYVLRDQLELNNPIRLRPGPIRRLHGAGRRTSDALLCAAGVSQWNTYRVARAVDVPENVELVFLNHPELPPGGAGEPSSRPTAAAIGNAIFDATGARLRRVPMIGAGVKNSTPQRGISRQACAVRGR
jgi:hypothetical protein